MDSLGTAISLWKGMFLPFLGIHFGPIFFFYDFRMFGLMLTGKMDREIKRLG
ncbi:hypothetical protein CRYUN_Cryun11dG0037000 [Craigia yunnanensis]